MYELLAVTDVVWQALIAGIVTIALGWIGLKNREEVAKTSSKLDDLATVADSTHILVNNNMEIQLRLNAIVTQRLADITHDPADIAAAETAQSLLKEHVAKQVTVDKKESKSI